MDKRLTKPLIAVFLILLAVLSCLYVADWASDPRTHAEVIRELEEKNRLLTSCLENMRDLIADALAAPGGASPAEK